MAAQVYYEIARWQLEQQLAEIRDLNSRLMGVFTGATAILVLFGALQDLGPISTNNVTLGAASAAVGFYVALLSTAIIGYRNPDLQLGPLASDLRDLDESADSVARMRAAISLERSVRSNQMLLRRKSQIVFIALVLWALDALLLLTTALIAAA